MVTVVVKLKTIPLALTLNKVTLGVLNIILVQECLKINAYIYVCIYIYIYIYVCIYIYIYIYIHIYIYIYI